jgi:hypothetical protein
MATFMCSSFVEFVLPNRSLHRTQWISPNLDDYLPNLPQPLPDPLRFFYPRHSQLIRLKEVEKKDQIRENSRLIMAPDLRHRKDFKIDFRLPDTPEVTVHVKLDCKIDELRQKGLKGLSPEQQRTVPRFFCIRFGSHWIDEELRIWEIGIAEGECCTLFSARRKHFKFQIGDDSKEKKIEIPDQIQTLDDFYDLFSLHYVGFKTPEVIVVANGKVLENPIELLMDDFPEFIVREKAAPSKPDAE